ncbi:hypothetical protein DOTSEDRAFT_90107 [Dothistroma septosporum NZE10]|uniref:Uncharacterized protein n=1 Tax=Dothistroma septosporum (strain NZE10 / CBS 128990) TaxID=675120 RepID=N1PEY0_DOTSN|nr:hypothetical protein DOTSEDRAFT_90107 [Dothistroma septosporum NZE10]
MSSVLGNRKRTCDEEFGLSNEDGHLDKRSRPTAGQGSHHGHHDSVLSTPASFTREQPKYDSEDDGSSSMISEPGSPQDISMSSDDEMNGDTFSQSPQDSFIMSRQRPSNSNPWAHRLQTNRVPTPIVSIRPGGSPLRTGLHQHVRQRHPQEFSSDHLDVPSPIDEDEVPTPPSAAEAAGSQLSMLTVSDVDMQETDSVPTINVHPVRPRSRNTNLDTYESAVESEPMESGPETIIVRKQRQRSGALSSGNSPVRAGPSQPPGRKGFSMGFRADCEKCRLRVPGHMNHLI